MGLLIRRIRLRRGDRKLLEELVGRRTTPQRVVERAEIVLSSAQGVSGSKICAQVGVSRPTVTQWLDRYEADGIEALLGDLPRSGRPRSVTAEHEAEFVCFETQFFNLMADDSRNWAVVGGLAVKVSVTGADIRNTVPGSDLVPKELWGVTDRIQAII